MRNPPTKEKQDYKNQIKEIQLENKQTVYLHTANQSSCNMLRGIPLKTLEQKAHREAKKRIESQRHPEFLRIDKERHNKIGKLERVILVAYHRFI